MSLSHSPETQRNLVSRIPQVTGKALPEWFECIDNGPAFLRSEEQIHWLADEHGLSHGYASAIVREHVRRRAAARQA